MRSRNEPSGGGAVFRAAACELLDSGLASDDLGVGFVDEGGGFRAVVAGFCGTGAGLQALSASCFARDAAVGAVRRELTSAGLVVSRGLGFTAVGPELLLEND